MNYGKSEDASELKVIVRIYEFDKETNCIVVERISGSAADFIEEYNRLKAIVFDEL